GIRAVVGLPPFDVGTREPDVDARTQELEHHLAREANAFGVRLDLHPRLDLAGARGDEHARALELDDADPARVHRRQVVGEAERRRVDALAAEGVQDGGALGHADGPAVDLELDQPRGWRERNDGHAVPPSKIWRRWTAESTAFAAS